MLSLGDFPSEGFERQLRRVTAGIDFGALERFLAILDFVEYSFFSGRVVDRLLRLNGPKFSF